MLSDAQIDEMENLIYFSEPDEVMEVLSKLIPVLFAELRITRGTLDSKVNLFLNGVSDAGNSTNEGANATSEDAAIARDGGEPVPEQPHEHQENHQGRVTQPELPASPSDPSASDKPEKKPRRVSVTRRHRQKKERDTGRLDAGASKPQVDRNASSKPKTAGRKRSKQVVVLEDEFPDLTGEGTC